MSSMIVDHIAHADLYAPLSPRFSKGLAFLKQLDFEALQPGRNEIDGSLFAMRQEYETRPLEKGLWEAHRKYADIQFVVEGVELAGVTPLESTCVSQEYQEDKDCSLHTGTGDFFRLGAGQFAIFFPQDVHMPCIAVAETPSPVKKVVVKVPLF